MKLQAYFQLKSRTKTVLYFCKLFNFFSVKQQNTSFQNEKQLLRQRLYSRMRITSKTVHDINKIKDNFALRFIFTYPGIISRAELVPSHGISRRRLGDQPPKGRSQDLEILTEPQKSLGTLYQVQQLLDQYRAPMFLPTF
jgi:hypothetical protein